MGLLGFSGYLGYLGLLSYLSLLGLLSLYLDNMELIHFMICASYEVRALNTFLIIQWK